MKTRTHKAVMKEEAKKQAQQNEFQDRILKVFESNPLAWGMMYFTHHFRDKSPSFHLKIVLEAIKNQFLAIQAPRESAKSTIITFLMPSHGIAFKKFRFIVIVQNTYKKSVRSLETIKKEFNDNHELRADFPITFDKDSEGDSIFRHKDGFETRVLCKGADQIGSVRGEKFGAYRPDLIIVDDLEDDELVRSSDRRKDLQELYDEALVPAGDRGKVKVVVIGTILHDDSLMAKLVSRNYYPEYRKLFYTALYTGKVSGREKSLWPEKWSVEDLKKLAKDKPDVFAKEYQGDPVSGVMGKFQKEDFRFWRVESGDYVCYGPDGEVTARGSFQGCKAAIGCDLAWDERRDADFSVIMPIFLTPNADILVDDYICKKGLRPNELEEILFSMEARLKILTKHPVPIGFEKAKLEKVMKHLLKRAMRERNRFLWFRDLQWDTDKISRIVTRLQPRYAQHTVFHKRGMGDLEHQLLRIPSGVHDDLPDALQGAVQLLEYPRAKKKEEKKDDAFEWWRRKAIEARRPIRNTFVFGKKKPFIPARESYR